MLKRFSCAKGDSKVTGVPSWLAGDYITMVIRTSILQEMTNSTIRDKEMIVVVIIAFLL